MNRRYKGEHFSTHPASFITLVLVLQVLVLLVVVSEPLDSRQDFPLDDDKGHEAAVVSSHVNETPLQARYTPAFAITRSKGSVNLPQGSVNLVKK